jgi:hypothetical protein
VSRNFLQNSVQRIQEVRFWTDRIWPFCQNPSQNTFLIHRRDMSRFQPMVSSPGANYVRFLKKLAILGLRWDQGCGTDQKSVDQFCTLFWDAEHVPKKHDFMKNMKNTNHDHYLTLDMQTATRLSYLRTCQHKNSSFFIFPQYKKHFTAQKVPKSF